MSSANSGSLPLLKTEVPSICRAIKGRVFIAAYRYLLTWTLFYWFYFLTCIIIIIIIIIKKTQSPESSEWLLGNLFAFENVVCLLRNSVSGNRMWDLLHQYSKIRKRDIQLDYAFSLNYKYVYGLWLWTRVWKYAVFPFPKAFPANVCCSRIAKYGWMRLLIFDLYPATASLGRLVVSTFS
jgi:hypothetical protein